MPLSPEEQRRLDELRYRQLLGKKQAAEVAAPLPEAMRATEKKRSLGGRPKETTPGAGRNTGGLLADIGLEGGSSIAGGVLTGGNPLGFMGGALIGNLLAQSRRILADEQEPEFKGGQLVTSTLLGGVPGAKAGLTTGRVLATEAGKQGAAGLTAKTAETLIDEGRLPTGTEVLLSTGLPAVGGAAAAKLGTKGADKLNETARKTLEDARKIGMSVTPSDVSDSWLNKRLESAAGPADVRREISLDNQKAANRNAATELGLPPDKEITRPVLNEVREKAAKPYQEIGELSGAARTQLETLRTTQADEIAAVRLSATDAHDLEIQLQQVAKKWDDPTTAKWMRDLEVLASADIQELRAARDLMNANRPPYAQADATREALFRETKEKVNTLEKNLQDAAKLAGRPELADELSKARTRIAKSHDIEKTLNIGDAGVSLPILGRLVDQKKSITGQLETMGKFAEAFPRNVQEGAKVIPFGLSKTEQLVGGVAALAGVSATGDVKNAALFLAPAAISTTARLLATSRPYQSLLAAKPFDLPLAEKITRLTSQAAGQESTR